MAIPAYLWLKDDGGSLIKGSVDVQNRESSIEVTSFSHNLYIPTDGNTGKLTGTRVHGALMFEKEFDSASPYLFKAFVAGDISAIAYKATTKYNTIARGNDKLW